MSPGTLRAISSLATRRRVLRGVRDGIATAVGLPLLDGFLTDNGTALAATGARIPARFCNWFWGLGLTPGLWEPAQRGAGYTMAPELAPLAPFRRRTNVFSGFGVILDDNPPVPHISGMRGILTGTCGKDERPSLDSLIADAIGGATRFHSLEVAATGNPASTVSRRAASVSNPSEISPLSFYGRVFGAEFSKPDAASFRPDPRLLAQRSVLSTIADERADLARMLGQEDRAKLEEYFTSLRALEHELALQAEPPPPADGCSVPTAPAPAPASTEIDVALSNHRLFGRLLAHAFACDQTRVATMVMSDAVSSLHKTGDTATHHVLTHDEPVDAQAGYQPQVKWFNDRIVEAFAEFLSALDGIREGDGTLLDHMMVFASTESGYAKAHTVTNVPMLTVGSASDRLKTGLHLNGASDPATRVGLTLQQAFGVQAGVWGAGSMRTSRAVTEILA